MRLIPATPGFLDALVGDSTLKPSSIADFRDNYENYAEAFHRHFHPEQRPHYLENAFYHKTRYIELVEHGWQGNVIDVGDDKPFLSYFLKYFNSGAEFSTISFELAQSPYPLFEVDIESERLPFDDNVFEEAIMTEVIEHMWRDPSMAISEIARCLKIGGRLFITTPNACERHAITCLLWQANPNQRGQYYSTLESGHLHLWTVGDLEHILTAHGFECSLVMTKDYAGYTKDYEAIEALIRQISPSPHLMGETIVIEALKRTHVSGPQYPKRIFPDGGPVQFAGAITTFANLARGSRDEPSTHGHAEVEGKRT
jgi:SAM-dependent methyltransferase